MHKKEFLIAIILTGFIFNSLQAQRKVILGTIKDQHSEERIPFASVEFKSSKLGKSADSAGNFRFDLESWPKDTLIITDIGYEDYKLSIDPNQIKGDTLRVPVHMVPGRITIDVIVKTKINRGLLMWKRIVKHKPEN